MISPAWVLSTSHSMLGNSRMAVQARSGEHLVETEDLCVLAHTGRSHHFELRAGRWRVSRRYGLLYTSRSRHAACCLCSKGGLLKDLYLTNGPGLLPQVLSWAVSPPYAVHHRCQYWVHARQRFSFNTSAFGASSAARIPAKAGAAPRSARADRLSSAK